MYTDLEFVCDTESLCAGEIDINKDLQAIFPSTGIFLACAFTRKNVNSYYLDHLEVQMYEPNFS